MELDDFLALGQDRLRRLHWRTCLAITRHRNKACRGSRRIFDSRSAVFNPDVVLLAVVEATGGGKTLSDGSKELRILQQQIALLQMKERH